MFYRSLLKTMVQPQSSLSTLIETAGVPNSAIKPSFNTSTGTMTVKINSTIRQFSRDEIVIHKQHILGHGMFAKCFLCSVGPLKACIKVFKYSIDDCFNNEANILMKCCHQTISYLFGVCLERRYKMMVLSFHGIDMQSYSLHRVLLSSSTSLSIEISSLAWKQIVLGVMSGIYYIHHKCGVIHNDIKEDNIILEVDKEQMKAVLIDFGKACLDGNGKKYNLSHEDKSIYKSKHPHIAPDLRDGLRNQDKLSDIYSFGRVLSTIFDKVLSIPALGALAQECVKYNAADRPTTEDMYTFINNLLTHSRYYSFINWHNFDCFSTSMQLCSVFLFKNLLLAKQNFY